MTYKVQAYIKLVQCISKSFTQAHFECCDRMINNLSVRYVKELSEMLLEKRVELIASQYPKTEA